ncbi:MAG: hypothetical protein AB7L66_12205 [Gemmatimonadales bacterium]
MLSIRSRVAGIGLAAGLMAGAVGSAQAQSRGIEVNGFAGLYAPTKTDGLEGTREALRRGSLAFGGRLTYWTGASLGVEGVAMFSPARARITANSGSQFARSTKVLAVGGKVMLNLTPKSNLLGIALGAGPTMVRTTSPLAPDRDAAKSEIGGVGGLALRIHLGENLALRGDAEDYFYSTDLGFGKKLTHDVVLSGGLSIHF